MGGTIQDLRGSLADLLRRWAEYFRWSMAGRVFSRVWWHAHARLSALYRRARQKPGVGKFADLARVGLTLYDVKPRPNPYEWRRGA